MKLYIEYQVDGVNIRRPFLYGLSDQTIFYDGIIYLRFGCHHDHSYWLYGFIYDQPKYLFPREFRRKRDLYDAVQDILMDVL